MSHVVMQAAEFTTLDEAQHAESELQSLCTAYIEFEETDPDPWNQDKVPEPLIEFGKRHNIVWPDDKSARFLLKGMFKDAAELLRVDRMVFFWGGGFDMGGEPLREILRKLGATDVRETCDLIIESENPDARIAELADFLEYEDFEDQFTVDPGEADRRYFSLEVVGPEHSRSIWFDDSGIQDWAFVALLPQLSGEDPHFADFPEK